MKITSYTYRHRRDFKAIYKCEACCYEEEDWGYDDRNFHENVIPSMPCPKCGKASGQQTSQHTIPEGVVM